MCYTTKLQQSRLMILLSSHSSYLTGSVTHKHNVFLQRFKFFLVAVAAICPHLSIFRSEVEAAKGHLKTAAEKVKIKLTIKLWNTLFICPSPQCISLSLTFMLHKGVRPPKAMGLSGLCGHLLMEHTLPRGPHIHSHTLRQHSSI